MKIKSTFTILMLLCSIVSASALRIAVFSDIHVTPGNENELQLRHAVNEINSADLDMVILCGDLSNEGSDEQLSNVKNILDNLRVPLCAIPGNHEDTWSQSAVKTFSDLWGNDRFVAEMDSIIIVGINCGPYMKMGDGHIKQEDLHWLKSTLDKHCTPGKRVLSFNHYPLLPGDLDNCTEYIQVLEKYPVIAHINGHYHSWRQYTAGGDDSGSNLPCAMVRALDMKKGDYGYSILDISGKSICIYNKPIGTPAELKFTLAIPSTPLQPVNPRKQAQIENPEGFIVEKVWTDSASIFTRLCIDRKNIYFGNSLGQARAIDKISHKLQWSIQTSGTSLYSRPVVLQKKNRIAFPTTNEEEGIIIVNSHSGKVENKYPSKCGPYVADGIISYDKKNYIQGGYKRIECRKAADGKLMWSYDSLFNYCQAAPVTDKSDLIFGAWDTNLRCLDVKTGKLRWVWNNGKSANMLGPGNVVPVVTSDKVIIVAPDRYMTAIDRQTGKQLWRDNSYRYRESLGHSEDRTTVYAKTMDGELVAVDATTPAFNKLWTLDLGLGYEHAPCIVKEVDNVIYAGSRRGILSLVDAEKQTLIASLPLGISEINGIDIDPYTNDIYVSLIEGTIFRISKNPRN